MAIFILLGVIVLITIVVLSVLFFMLGKEEKKTEEAVPVTNLEEINKELSGKMFKQNDQKVIEKDSEIIPVFESNVELPLQPVQTPAQPSQEDEAYRKKAQELEEELLNISKKADNQSDEARQLIADLTKENESLKSQKVDLEVAQQKLAELQGESSLLKTENVSLQNELEGTNAKVRLLEEQMTAFKVQMGEEVSRAQETVAQLIREKEELLSAPKPEPQAQPIPDQQMLQELTTLKGEHAQLKERYDVLEKTREQLEYDLIKARAQTSGLERISFNYKNQLEDFFKKINAVQVTNDHLAQTKNRLEGMVEEIKIQNEELVKKDQLSQFELEKNRSRLSNLERECEELKVRIQQQS